MQAKTTSLGRLADPKHYTEPIELGRYDGAQLAGFLRSMMLIREVEERIADWITEGRVKCPCHLAIGQEAPAAGVARALRGTDRAFGSHRSHAHYLAMGGDVFHLFSEVLGRVDGCSKGMGGSMHLYADSVGFKGSVPIVAATVPIATGAGLAAKMERTGDVAVAFFGDGAAEEGVVHESLNLASVMKLPVLFVCENNLFSSHLDIELRQPSNRVSRYAEAHDMAYRLVDGNDVVAVADAAQELVEQARQGKGPGFLEAVTYRWRGHVGPAEDLDVGLRRSMDELRAWKLRDPIRRLAEPLQTKNILSAADQAAMLSEVKLLTATAMEKALCSPFPPASSLLDLVYSGAAPQ